MTENKVHMFDVGTVIEIDMNESLADVADAELHVQKPDGSEVVWTAVVGAETLSYETASGDLDMAGRWIIQPYLRFAGSLVWKGHGDSVFLNVYPDYSLD